MDGNSGGLKYVVCVYLSPAPCRRLVLGGRVSLVHVAIDVMRDCLRLSGAAVVVVTRDLMVGCYGLDLPPLGEGGCTVVSSRQWKATDIFSGPSQE